MGLVTSPTFWPDVPTQKVAQRSMELYSKLAEKGNFRFNRCGRVYLAHSRAAELHARRIHSRLLAYGHDSEVIDDPSEMLARWPMLNTEDIKLAVTSPDDVVVDPLGLSTELAEAARGLGVEIFEDCNVKKVLIGEGNAVYAVDTDDGLVETKAFVSATGLWSSMLPVKDLYDRFVKKIPAHPCTYTFLSTGRLPQDGVSDQTPVIVDLDNGTYVCPSTFGTICGGFVEADIAALSLPHDAVSDWHVPLPDWDRFYSVLTRLLDRCPSLKQVPHGDLVCTAEMYTPDIYPIIGEPDQLRGYYLANGFNGQGLSLAGGMGDVLAQWILEGHSDIDVSRYDVTRFMPLHSNPQYLFERTPEVASNTFNALHYSHQSHTARNLRMSPIYHQLRDAGAVFGEIMGYERPLWFGANKEKGRNANYYGQDCLIGLPEWFPSVAKEYEACRERVGLIDMTSFSKFEVKGPDVVPFLQKVCSANIDRPIGTTVYTGMQDERGGYVTDCTLSRLSDNHYFIVAPTIQQVRLPAWLNKWISEWEVKVTVQDVTSLYTAMNIVGPSSRYLMQDISGRQMASHEFPTFACRELNVGMAAGVRAVSVSHCGELGWVLYCPNEVVQNVYEQLVEAGKQYSMAHAGYYTLRHLRIEKFYVYWGQDINASVTPVECGRAFRVDFNKDFIGKDALLKQMERGVTKRFVQLLVDNHKIEEDPWPQGNEVIYRNGKPSGWTTSAAYGFTLRCHVCIGYLEDFNFGVSPEFINSGTYEIDIAGKRFPVRVNLHSPSLPMVSSEHPTHYRPTQ